MYKHVNTRREEHAYTLIFCVHIHVHPLERMQTHALTGTLTHTRARAGTHSHANSRIQVRMHTYACACGRPGTHNCCLGSLTRTDTGYNYTGARSVVMLSRVADTNSLRVPTVTRRWRGAR